MMDALVFLRGTEMRLAPIELFAYDELVTNPDDYVLTAEVLWRGGRLPMTLDNGRIQFNDGQWALILQEDELATVPLGKLSRLVITVLNPDDGITRKASVPILMRTP